jgi:ATP-dependent protease ClpP protease subunit
MFDVSKSQGRIRAYGDVGADFDQESFMRAFDELAGDDVEIMIQSRGGDVQSGISIYNQIADYPGNVTAVIDAEAGSIATIFPLSSDRIEAYPQSKLFIHNPWTIAMGDARDFRHTAEILDMLAADLAGIYAERTGSKPEYWLGIMDGETFFSADEAIEAGLVDAIREPKGRQKPAKAASAGARGRRGYLAATMARMKMITQGFDTGR